MEGAPDRFVIPEEPKDLNILKCRLGLGQAQTAETSATPTAASGWYDDAQRLMEALGGHDVNDQQLEDIAIAIGVDLNLILGREAADGGIHEIPEATLHP